MIDFVVGFLIRADFLLGFLTGAAVMLVGSIVIGWLVNWKGGKK